MAEERVIIVNPDAQAREQFAEEMKHLREHPLDKAPKAGGYYINADGLGAHDAEGNAVPLRNADKKLADELRSINEKRKEQEAEEVVPLDSPEEVADRERALREAGGGRVPQLPFTPAAVEEGSVLPQDGTTSQPDTRKKSARKAR